MEAKWKVLLMKIRQGFSTRLHRTVFTTSPSGAKVETTFHQRPLPSLLTSLTSERGKAMFATALKEGNAEGYFSLVGNFTTQAEVAYCGPSSMAMALNALEIDPMKRWKGSWRWYSEEIILDDACLPKSHVLSNGLTYGQFACIARKHCHVVSHRADTVTLEQFRRHVKATCRSNKNFIVSSFSRSALGQTGQGHYSPIGAYSEEHDAILILDTARFKYPSYFVETQQLYDAMRSIDPETTRPRGYFQLSAHHPSTTPTPPECRMRCLKILNALTP